MKDLKTFKNMLVQLFEIITRRQKRQLLWMLVIIIVGSFLELLGVSIIIPFIQSILDPESLAEKPYVRPFVSLFNLADSVSLIVFVGICIIAVYIFKNAFLAFSSYMRAYISTTIQKELSVTMMDSYMRHPYSFYVSHDSGEIMRGINDDVWGVCYIIQNLINLVSESLTVMMIAFYLAAVDAQLAVCVILFGLIIALLIVFVLKKKIKSMTLIVRGATAERNNWIIEGVSGIKEIMVFGKQEHYIKGYRSAYERCARFVTAFEFISALPERIIETICISGIIISVLLRLLSGVDPNTFVVSLAAFAMGAFRILPSFSRMTGYMTGLVQGRPMLESTYVNITEARDYSNRIAQASIEEDVEESVEFKDRIEIRSLDWKYETGKEKVLTGLNLTINKGDMIGIIGESGSGKSTLSDLLLQLYRPVTGEILMDGVDIKTIPRSWKKTVSFVPQSVFLMNASIKANVAFGETEIDEDRVWEVLKKAAIDEFVRSLPEGLNTVVGERGVRFSGGQKQRIAIARALYFNPKILILDEATSALDNETENSVMDAIEGLAGEITLIIIAHRVTTLKSCNRIYEITGGKAIERSKDDVLNVSAKV